MIAHFSSARGEDVAAPIQDQAKAFNRILVVDDDRDIRQLCADSLIRSGYQVDTAEDGAAGWEALHANSYDLLVTDNNMPKVSGVELVKKLRSARVNLPVVLASGAIPTEEIDRDPSLHLAATLSKPFTIVELLDTVKKSLRVMGSPRNRRGISLPVPADDARQLPPASRWGINE